MIAAVIAGVVAVVAIVLVLFFRSQAREQVLAARDHFDGARIGVDHDQDAAGRRDQGAVQAQREGAGLTFCVADED